jgi:predicted transcriptional regulator
MAERSLKDLFHLVSRVLPDNQEIITFPPTKRVGEALEMMRKGNFSQVPIVVGNEVLGVFSYRSFSKKVMKLPEKERIDLPSLPVEEFIEDLRFVQITDDLATLLDELEIKDAVLIGLQNRLQGIVTTIDALRYFYRVANPYVLVG